MIMVMVGSKIIADVPHHLEFRVQIEKREINAHTVQKTGHTTKQTSVLQTNPLVQENFLHYTYVPWQKIIYSSFRLMYTRKLMYTVQKTGHTIEQTSIKQESFLHMYTHASKLKAMQCICHKLCYSHFGMSTNIHLTLHAYPKL